MKPIFDKYDRFIIMTACYLIIVESVLEAIFE